MADKEIPNPNVPRIPVEEARSEAASGDAMLICAYEDQQKCEDMRVQGGLTYQEFRQKQEDLPRDTRLIFYCA